MIGQYYIKNREKMLAQQREYYIKNREKILVRNKEYSKEYRIKNREKISARRKEYRIKNREKILTQEKKCRIKNKERMLIWSKEYYIKNREKILAQNKEYSKEYCIKNKEKILAQFKNKKEYYKENKNEYAKRHCIWQKKNIEKVYAYQIAYRRKRRQEDKIYKMIHNLRTRMAIGLKKANGIKGDKMVNLIGCSYNYLKEHLEKQFDKNMTWNNYGRKGWHIDHIKPCNLFDLTKISEQQECFHYTNLQPLWAEDNLTKRNIYINNSCIN